MSGAPGRRGFFVRSTVVAFWGHALPPFSKDHLVAKLHCFGLQHFGEREGLLAALGSCKSGCPSCFAEASEGGVSPRLEVGGFSLFSARFDRVLVLAVRVCVALRLQLFLRMRLRLLYLCLRAWPPCCRKCRWCCCLSRCVGVGQGPRSPPAFCRAAGHRAPREASCQLVSMLGFCTKCQCFSLTCFALHRVGLQHLGRGRGFRSRGLFGCCRFNQIWMLFLFRRCFRTGCQSEARGWGVSLFCARFVLSRLRLLCFEARLSGCCVREGGVKGVNPGFLVLAFSTRTFESSGVPARRVPGASAWACCLWFVAFVRSLLSGCVCFWCLCAGRIYSSEGLCRRASQS